VRGFDPLAIAVGLLGAAIVYVSYYPSDSVAVEQGDALWFCALAIVIATITCSAWLFAGARPFGSIVASCCLDIAVGVLAAWMMMAAMASSPPGNLRMASNEAWWWVAAAALLTSLRRLACNLGTRRAVTVLLVACAVGLAVHGLHQQLISLPANRAEYQQDPERVLQLADVDAPPGSAERMMFENRLMDGGPTGTFALANSLAAVLLLVVTVSVGMLRFQWTMLSRSQRGAWAGAALLCAGCLLAARSRSAMLAMLVGSVLVWFAASRYRGRNPKATLLGLVGISLAGVAVAAFIAIKGNREWFEEAPASLAFRFQYWRSTWSLALDHPWLGAGPGNFQSRYERYREATATEQIAEPHNLFFETLASGGFPALLLLAIALTSIVWIVHTRRGLAAGEMAGGTGRDRWLWLGALLALGMVWLIGWASRQPPDWEANLFALPAAIAAAVLLSTSIQGLASRDLDSILSVALITVGIHLMISGGWTVPGVAAPLWLCAGMLTRIECPVPVAGRGKPIAAALACGCGLCVLAGLYAFSLRPVEERKRWMAVAASAQSRGQLGKTQATLEQAAQVDPHSPEVVIWLADFYRWKLVLQADDDPWRDAWEASLQEAKSRAGDDPAIYRMIGAQQLHLYQRHGRRRDLDAAAETFSQAVQWSPANEWMFAQLAVIEAARGQPQRATRLGARARELAGLGGNIERAISRQLVYVVAPLGKAAENGPLRRPADEVLPEPGGEE
jgi:O-antigen ligase